jgi:hypothetical protein
VFLKTHKEANPFKNEGWIYLEKMSQIMPATVRGNNVFRPSQGATGIEAGIIGGDDEEAGQATPEPASLLNGDEEPEVSIFLGALLELTGL